MNQQKTRNLVERSRTRIRIYDEHLGYIDKEFLEAFQLKCQIPKINHWIKQRACQEFGLYISGKEDLEVLGALLSDRYYENVVEWVKEEMRRMMYVSQ